jgi:hypothetical protein
MGRAIQDDDLRIGDPGLGLRAPRKYRDQGVSSAGVRAG